MNARGEADRIELAGLEFHRRVHQGFVAQAQQQGKEFVAVDGSLNQAAVAKQIQSIVSQYLHTWYAS